jgi:5-methylcytosine-specific restriction endonuclease McrA
MFRFVWKKIKIMNFSFEEIVVMGVKIRLLQYVLQYRIVEQSASFERKQDELAVRNAGQAWRWWRDNQQAAKRRDIALRKTAGEIIPRQTRVEETAAARKKREVSERRQIRAGGKAERQRERGRLRMRTLRESPEWLEKERLRIRLYMQRKRMLNPEYACQWSRNPRNGRWYRAKKSADGTITSAVLKMLQQEILCPYCLVRLTPDNLVLDHVDPFALGGKHSADNLAATCHDCNAAKAAMPLLQFMMRRQNLARS